VPFDPLNDPVKLEQVGRNTFHLLKPFAYIARDGTRYEITREGVGDSDLASVPWILWWFVASYGRHTRPALVHDQLVDQIERHKADRLFRDALKEVKIGWFHRWLIWTAVSLETTFRTFAMPDDPAKEGVNKQRKGRWVTIVGFPLVAAHLAVGVVAVASARDASRLWQILAWLLVATWFAAWRVRGLLFVAGLILIVPAMLVLLVPLLVVWVFEGGPWHLLRLAWWFLAKAVMGGDTPRPTVPPIGPTRQIGIERV
jgi:Protein of unknown function (DUF1353)